MIYAIDTETEAIDFSARPYRPPRLILGTIAAEDGTCDLHAPEAFAAELERLLRSGAHLIFHNLAFDHGVICQAFPHLRPLFDDAVDAGRVHDTLILDQLLQIARGDRTSAMARIRARSLAVLSRELCHISLDKDPTLRCGFGAYAGRLKELPCDMREYALADARATLQVYKALVLRLEHAAGAPSTYPVHPGARSRWGLCSAMIQVKGAIAHAWLEQQAVVRVDLEAVAAYRDRIQRDITEAEERLIALGLAHRTPKRKQFRLRLKAVRALAVDYARTHDLALEYTPTGQVSLEDSFWKRNLDPNSDSPLVLYFHYARLRKLQSTYLVPYGRSAEHYPSYYNIGCFTGRTSSRSPNIQQVPKRRYSLRGLFIPRPGYCFVEADFQQAELVALAQIQLSLWGASKLADAINSGTDPHSATAKRIFGRIDADLRQAAKAVNFGLPGGMGVTRFRHFARQYGLTLTEDRARRLRRAALKADPQLCQYLAQDGPDALLAVAADNLGLDLQELLIRLAGEDRWLLDDLSDSRYVFWRRLRAWSREWPKSEIDIPVPPGFNPRFDLFRVTTRTLTGRVRQKASYTEARNTPFQGLVADALKLSLWRLYRAWSPSSPWFPVLQVHDSILIEARSDYSTAAAEVLGDAMRTSLSELCPSVRVGVDVEIKPRWGPILSEEET